MTIAIALLGFNDLGHLMTPTILISTLSKNEKKINVGS